MESLIDIRRPRPTGTRSWPRAAFLVVSWVLACPSIAQETHLTFHGRRFWKLTAVRPVGDIDLDGVPDLVLGAPGARTGNVVGGAVMVVSGVDGDPIHPPIYGPHLYNFGFYVTGVGDFDGDGTPDFASGVPNDGYLSVDGEVYVWSGRTSELLAFIPAPFGVDRLFGRGVFELGDLNGDGFGELAAVYDAEGDILIYSGPDGCLLRAHREGGGEPWVTSIGDVDLDGVPDYVVGWHGFFGKAVVFSGSSGKELYRVMGYTLDFAHSVAPLGDISGDGIPDFAVGATQDGDGTCNSPDPGTGFVRFYSGADGKRLRQIDGSRIAAWASGCSFRVLDGGLDVNGDGVGDLIAGSPWADLYFDPILGLWRGGMVAVYSGATGTMLWRMRPGGWYLSLLGDLDGDGLSEFAYGVPWDYKHGYFSGKVTVHKGAPGDAQRVCTALRNSMGSAATIDLEGPISVGGNELHLVVEGGVPGELGTFFYGPELVQVPFGDGFLCAGGGAIGLRRMRGPVALDAAGNLLMAVDMTRGPMAAGPAAWTPGSTWTVQFWYRDPGGPGGSGFNLSDAMRITFTP